MLVALLCLRPNCARGSVVVFVCNQRGSLCAVLGIERIQVRVLQRMNLFRNNVGTHYLNLIIFIVLVARPCLL